jgi:hypothetical protein
VWSVCVTKSPMTQWTHDRIAKGPSAAPYRGKRQPPPSFRQRLCAIVRQGQPKLVGVHSGCAFAEIGSTSLSRWPKKDTQRRQYVRRSAKSYRSRSVPRTLGHFASRISPESKSSRRSDLHSLALSLPFLPSAFEGPYVPTTGWCCCVGLSLW